MGIFDRKSILDGFLIQRPAIPKPIGETTQANSPNMARGFLEA